MLPPSSLTLILYGQWMSSLYSAFNSYRSILYYSPGNFFIGASSFESFAAEALSIQSAAFSESLTKSKHMAHIADFMVETKSSVGLNNYIAREVSPKPRHDAAVCLFYPPMSCTTHSFQIRIVTPTNENETYVWRMHQPSEPRKYQLFPAKDKLSIAAGRKSPDPETVLSSTMGPGEKERSIPGGAIRTKSKEQTLIRRRKVSVPELGPMTTVQEIAMDSRELLQEQLGHVYLKLTFPSSNHTRPPTTARTINQCSRKQLASTCVWRKHIVLHIRTCIGRERRDLCIRHNLLHNRVSERRI